MRVPGPREPVAVLPGSFNALIAWVDQPVRSVVYEPTGPWHRAFEEALLQAGLPLARANPLQARRFAQAMGQRAKTDAVDARVLAQMGTALHLRPTEASSPTQRALEELQMARDALVTDRTAARNRQKHLRHRLLRQQSKTRLSQIDRHLAAVDAEIAKRLAEDKCKDCPDAGFAVRGHRSPAQGRALPCRYVRSPEVTLGSAATFDHRTYKSAPGPECTDSPPEADDPFPRSGP